jgi:bzd-type benzoyl-CoA reductase Q subunit
MSGVPECLRAWTEQGFHDATLDPSQADVISAGVDVGSVSSQAVVCLDGKLYAWASRRTGVSSPDSARAVMQQALAPTGLTIERLHFVVGTGYGRVNVPFAHKAVTEIHCHAKGGHFMYGPAVRTLLDMGGQDCKAIRCDERGKVTAFLMNDKCAAGTGRGVEVFAELLQVPIDEVGPLSLAVAEEPPPVSSMCVVYAKSEATQLLRQGRDKNSVLAAYCGAMAQRVVSLLGRLGVERDFAITGGIAKNIGIVSRIERALGVTALTPTLDPQIAGALGAALFAQTLEQKRRGAS